MTSPAGPIRTLIVDDEWMVRSVLRAILEAAPDITVTGEASDGVEVVGLARTLRPDVVLMDIRMPQGDGLTATERIVRLAPPPYVVVLTTFDLDEYVHATLRNGAVGFLLNFAEHGSPQLKPETLAVRPFTDLGSVVELGNRFGGAQPLHEAIDE